MASSGQVATALLTEHLRYTPLTLVDDIINTVNELTNRAVDAAEEGLLAADPAALGFAARALAENRVPEKDVDGKVTYSEAHSEIEEGVHKLETLLEANIDRNFDKFEILALRGILSVPQDLVSWMRLAHYDAATDITSIETLPTTESLQQLLEQLQETRKLQKALKTTISRNSAVIEKLKSLTAIQVDPSSDLQTMPGPLAFLAHSHSASHLGLSSSIGGFVSEKKAIPLSTNVSFALSQLPALQTLLNQLRPILGELSVSADLPAMEADIAKERRYYLETQSRLAMERQGISTGNQTSELLGRIPSTDELAALEEMVDAIND